MTHRLVAAALLLLLPLSAAAQQIRLLAPRNRAVVSEDTLTVLGTAARGTEVPWSIDRKGKAETGKTKAEWGDLFEVFIVLEAGINRVTVGGETLEVFYAVGSASPPKGFTRQRLHAGDISRCDDCHDSLTMSLKEGGYPGACMTCHVVVSSNPANKKPARDHGHFRSATAECGRCHDAHVSSDPKLLRDTPVALCGSCHDAQKAGAPAHPAFEEGGCAACHDPHYSGYAKELIEPLPALCGRCHDQSPDPTKGRPHPPMVQKGSCSLCHDSHGSERQLLKGPARSTCSPCHGEVQKHGHKDRLTECSSCHDSHKPLGKGMLATGLDKVCRECHAGVGRGTTVHAALEEGCDACHDPHRDEDRIAAASSCVQCHDLQKDAQLAGLHGGLSIEAKACPSCHPSHASDYDKLLKGRLHDPLKQGKCSACHGGGTERSTNVENPAERCRMCHSVEKDLQAKGAQLHDPVSEGDCSACHDPHMARQRALLKQPETDLCRECHDVKQAGGGRTLHEPASTCTECHGAHGGTKKALLSEAVPALCLNCHDDPRKAVGEAVHPALDEGCLVCHEPHAGFEPGLLKGDQPYSSCRECHEVPDVSGGRTLHTAAKACSSCHAPHGGKGPKYLPAKPDEMCARCHADVGKKANVHPALEEGCRSCHDSHSGFSGASLVKPQKELCLGCHDDPTANKAVPHKVGDRGCAGCHDPHASDNKKLLRAPGTALCRTCHDFREGQAGRGLHEPAGDCFECHEKAPHGGTKPTFLANRPPELCIQCHDDPRKGEGTVHPALDEGCLVCHDPHAGFRPGVLRGASARAPCVECHDDPTQGMTTAHRPVQEGCAACHEPHASSQAHFLKRSGNALCLGCHDVKRHNHSIDADRGSRFPASESFAREGGQYACSGCHLPHGSKERRLFAKPEVEFCVTCHRF